jgi:hypothetical protein
MGPSGGALLILFLIYGPRTGREIRFGGGSIRNQSRTIRGRTVHGWPHLVSSMPSIWNCTRMESHSLLDRDVRGLACNPRCTYLDGGHPFCCIRRNPKVHLIAVHRAGVTDSGQNFGGFPVHYYVNR